jgi:hypothetical protein
VQLVTLQEGILFFCKVGRKRNISFYTVKAMNDLNG